MQRKTEEDPGIGVCVLESRYPQGAQNILIHNATGRTVPRGARHTSVGVMMLNVTTVSSIGKFLKTGMPLVNKRLTVAGDAVAYPKNLEVPIRTPIADVLAFWGTREEPRKVIMGATAAILVTKQLFGGIGHNFANPAIVGRIALAVSFPSLMTAYPYPQTLSGVDILSSATPLAAHGQSLPLLDLFLGTHGGVLGETCALALLIGFGWLLCTRTVELTIPLAYLGTVAAMSALCGQNVLTQLLSGGLFWGAFFMATDYTTSPFTRKGKLIFGVGCGLITCAIRFWGNMNEGVSYSILLMNLTVPYINAKTRKTPMGGGKRK